MTVLTTDAARVLRELTPRQLEIVDEHVGDLDEPSVSAGDLAELFWERAREERSHGDGPALVLAREFDALAVKFQPDPLWPAGGRPACRSCQAKPVYMAGLCGDCWAAQGAAGGAS